MDTEEVEDSHPRELSHPETTDDLFGKNNIAEDHYNGDEVHTEESNVNLMEFSLTETVEEVNLEVRYESKIHEIENAVKNREVKTIKTLSIEEGGLVTDKLRKQAWPILLSIDIDTNIQMPDKEHIESFASYEQVVMDVNRTLKRFPPGIDDVQRVVMQDQLIRVICTVLMKHPELHYYQGYHDIAITLLLVCGEEIGLQILETLSLHHLREFMHPTMEKTQHLLNYMFPIVFRTNRKLYNHIWQSEVGSAFSVAWVITWYSHVLESYRDVVRLFDFFIATPPLTSIYLSAAIVVHRQDAILSTDCEMSQVYAVISKVPADLPFEDLLEKTILLYAKYPPDKMEVEAQRITTYLARYRRPKRHKFWLFGLVDDIYWLLTDPEYKALVLWTVAASLTGYMCYYYIKHRDTSTTK